MTTTNESVGVDMIWCPSCHKFKPATEFHINRNKANGKQTYCKKCMCEITNKNKKKKEAGEAIKRGRPSCFSDETVKEMKEYRNAGFSYKEIAEFVGANESTVRMFFLRKCTVEERTPKVEQPQQETSKMEIISKFQESIENNNHTKEAPMPPKTNSIPKASLSDFQPRELIKHLYNLGYRIEDGKLVCLVKQTVNLKDIINA